MLDGDDDDDDRAPYDDANAKTANIRIVPTIVVSSSIAIVVMLVIVFISLTSSSCWS